nr:hypothetical protein GCM10017745_51070 [Saccharothrix mutabilis subsp. capreolus]
MVTSAQDGTLRVHGKCLDAAGAPAPWGRPLVRLWSCDGSDQQRWQARPDRSVVSAWNGSCLDGTFGRAGDPVTTDPCHGGDSQKWDLPTRYADFGTLVGAGGKCLETADGHSEAGTAVRLGACLSPFYAPGAARQHLTHAPDGTLRVFDKCLASGDADSTVVVKVCDGTDSQRWLSRPDHGLVAASTGLCLHDEGDYAAVTRTCTPSAAQAWRFTKPAPAPVGADRLSPGERLASGQSKTSPNGLYRLAMQSDGNLVLYDNTTRQALWNSFTFDTGATYAVLQTDGNFVLYSDSGQARWDSHTWGSAATRLVVQSDSNIVLYGPDATPYWHRWMRPRDSQEVGQAVAGQVPGAGTRSCRRREVPVTPTVGQCPSGDSALRLPAAGAPASGVKDLECGNPVIRPVRRSGRRRSHLGGSGWRWREV